MSRELDRTRIPTLDGLRGIAILLVLLHHFNLRSQNTRFDIWWSDLASCGWVGVDLFFVLSGFLITGILWRTRSTPRYFLNFYARRTLRIFPLYYAYVGAMMIVFSALGGSYPAQVSTTITNQLWVWLYGTNILLTRAGDWTRAVPGFNHFWSLAVEEQFYLLWPTLIWLVPGRKTMTRVTIALIAAAPFFRAGWCLSGASPLGAYVLTPARMDSLAMGSVVFLMTDSGSGFELAQKYSKVTIIVSLLFLTIVFSAWGTNPELPIVSTLSFSLLSLLFGAALVISISAKPSLLTTICSFGCLRSMGKYSYAMYVLHPSVRRVVMDKVIAHVPMVLGSDMLRQLLLYVGGIGLSFGLASASWRILESKFLKLKDHFPYPKTEANSGQPD